MIGLNDIPANEFRFYANNIAISCTVEWNSDLGGWIATSNEGFHGSSRSSRATAALNCFSAWLSMERSWYESNE